jgi:hypothetical protein
MRWEEGELRQWARALPWARIGVAAGVVLAAVALAAAVGAVSGSSSTARPVAQTAGGPALDAPGGAAPAQERDQAADTHPAAAAQHVAMHPTERFLTRADAPVFDVRKLKSTVVRVERPEHEDPIGFGGDADAETAPTTALPATVTPSQITAASAPAPGPDSSFDGLDFAIWGAGHPPDTNGDVGPTYYIETVNTSIGIYDKSTGNRVAAFTFNAFMSQGHFGNLCDTNNFGDPVVLYDSFEDRWFITDFAFALDSGGNVNPQAVYQCIAVSKTGDPVNGGWNYYSILAPGGLADYPKFGVWPDGIYMSANMFGYSSGSSYTGFHVWAFNKQQMYAGAPSPQVVDFAGDTSDFTLLPANARLQTGTPPAGSPEYYVSTEQFLNALSIYKFHVDWDKVSTSTFTGPSTQLQPNCWPNQAPASASTPANAADVLPIRAMAQAQYTNQGGAESLWVVHTVQRNVSATNSTCNATTGGNATIRWYQANVTGGTVAPSVVQGATFDPDGANTFYRFMPALAVDRAGDMGVVYSKSNATTNPQIKYAGRLFSDPLNTLGQDEQTLIDGTGAQSGSCGGGTCIRWGDYSGMALDPNGCEFWMANEYYVTTGLNDLTRIGSFHYPGCTPVGNGTLSGTVTDGTSPLRGVTVSLGNRTTTTDPTGAYSFTVPAGTYPTETAALAGYLTGSASSLAVPDGGTLTTNFTLSTAPTAGCFADNTQTSFQRGVATNCDLTASPGQVTLLDQNVVNQKNENLGGFGVGISTTTWGGQTFTPSASGQLTKADVNLFCASCTGTTPSLTLSIRATSGGLPTGADLVSGTIPGFSNGGSAYYSVTFGTPLSVTAGTQYALVIRPTATPSAGTYALTRSGTQTVGADVYPGGARVAGATSGTAWSIPLTGGVSSDAGFHVTIDSGFPATGTFVSSLKDANPAAGSTPNWTTLTFSATTPANTAVSFQVAGSNSAFGPFNFVGPDGTSGTFFTTSGADLSQFDGFRYLRYKAYLSSSDPSVTPALSSVLVCFQDVSTLAATTLVVAPASGTFGGTTTLSATLKAGSTPVAGESVAFTLNGASVGGATTGANGVATLGSVSLAGIAAGSYPTAVGASFAGDTAFGPSNGSSSLTVAKADQAISVVTHAPSTAVFDTGFTVSATGGGSGNPVVYSSSGACSNNGASFTMTSGTGNCSFMYHHAGDAN